MQPALPLDLLCCPVTGQPLRAATPEELQKSPTPLTEGLIRQDGLVIYPVQNGIPLLLPTSGLKIAPN